MLLRQAGCNSQTWAMKFDYIGQEDAIDAIKQIDWVGMMAVWNHIWRLTLSTLLQDGVLRDLWGSCFKYNLAAIFGQAHQISSVPDHARVRALCTLEHGFCNVGILKKKPVHRAWRVGTVMIARQEGTEDVVCAYIGWMWKGSRKYRVLIFAPDWHPLDRIDIGSRILHGIDIGLGVEEAWLDFKDFFRISRTVLAVMLWLAPHLWIFLALYRDVIESEWFDSCFQSAFDENLGFYVGERNSNFAKASCSLKRKAGVDGTGSFFYLLLIFEIRFKIWKIFFGVRQ